jgi:HK97 gp10 family phage protein
MARTRVVIYEPGMDHLSRVVDQKFVHPVTDAVAEDARRYCPVLSGDLLATIREEHLEGEGRVHCGDVAAGIDYHLYQEFGTSKMSAQPYMRPALYKGRGGAL